MVQRGRTVCLIQLSQAVINTADLLVVGFLSIWSDVGRYGAPHRMVTALLTFGLILQQAAFPTLSRLWRQTAGAGREALDSLVEVLDDRIGAGGRRLHGARRPLGPPGAAGRITRGRGSCWPWASGEHPC